MERSLTIEKFRNIGLKSSERLVLNNSLEKGKMGNLVIVIGANNSGKSNVLDALKAFDSQKLSSRDVTTLNHADEYRKPAISLVTKDGADIFSYKILYNNATPFVTYPMNNKSFCERKEEAKQLITTIQAELTDRALNDTFQLNSKLENLKQLTKIQELSQLESQLEDCLRALKSSANYNRNYHYVVNNIKEKCTNIRMVSEIYDNTDAITILKSKYLDKYGINFLPKIYSYEEKKLSTAELKCSANNISNNKFMKSVFTAININVLEIENAYKQFNELQDKGILKDLENKLNKKLKTVAKKFNTLYILDDDTYKFEISCESNELYFYMSRNGKSITLDYQSTGFKWFFNLYFNLLCSTTLSAGDIVIMDEPATNLHIRGQMELRKFLKDFAIKNDITIVLATHSPFLIDMDYLDELRVLALGDDNCAHIENDFSTIDIDDPDSLKPIKEALTVTNHILLDPNKKVVFVEGITDYNYMVAFKNKFQIENIVFLPIKGVGAYNSPDFKEKQIEISKRLISIRKNSPILMVDGDGAGKAMKKANEKDSALTVFTLSDVSENFKTIENVFSDADLQTFGFELNNGNYVKRSSTSAQFKTFDVAKASKETDNNFKLIFNHIDNL